MRTLLSLILLSSSCFATISANTVWEVRTTGADTNGGAFVALATGTDMSQFDNKNAAACTSCQSTTVNISTTDAVTNNTTTVTSATGNFSAAIVGNLIWLSGTGTTTGWYQVATFTNATTVVVDRATGSTGGTGVSMNIGGALATLGQVATNAIASNTIFVKATATYSLTSGVTFAQTQVPDNTHAPTILRGYTTARTDNGRATIQQASGATTVLNMSGNGVLVENLIVDCNSVAGTTGIAVSNYSRVNNVKVTNCGTRGLIQTGANTVITNAEVTGGLSGCTSGITLSGNSQIYYSRSHGNLCTGIVLSTGDAILASIIDANTGASSDGISATQLGERIVGNTISGNGRDGIRYSATYDIPHLFQNNILSTNGGWGLNSTVALPARFDHDGNAYYSNTSGTRNNLDSTAGIAVYGVAPYTNLYDITLSASPFTAAGSGDFTLNNAAGGGAAVRGHGMAGAIAGVSQTGFIDMGALQHQDAGGGTVGYALVQ